MSDEILIRVKAVCEQDYDGSYGSPDLKHEQVTVQQLIQEQHEYLFNSQGFVRIESKKGIDQRTADFLRSHGWVHAETAKSREEKKTVEQEYYIVDEKGHSGYFYDPKFHKVSVDALTDDQLGQLARGARLVQVVTPRSVLPSTQYKKLLTKKKQIEARKEQAKITAAKKAERKKAKEIAAAKKLLEEVGQ